jgi:AcrR family transcriptional regulator
MNPDKKQYHHGDLRATLLEVAAGIIAEDGVDRVTMRALSQQAGVSRAAPYRHFPDKTALLCDVAAAGFNKLEKQLRIAADKHSGADAVSRLEGMAMAYVDFAVDNPAYYRLMFGREDLVRSTTPELRINAQAAFKVLQKAIGEWQPLGIGAKEGGAVPLTYVLWATVHGLAMLLIDRQIQHGEKELGIHPLLAGENALTANDFRKLIRLAIQTVLSGMKNR